MFWEVTSRLFVQMVLLLDISFSHSAQRHRQTDGRTDRRTTYAISRSHCV